ncbi:MAG: alpha/beta hydrolase-fold protein [Candidatus Sumerlaeaceae bacterium]|nr:alpha/beta hydrolase-fold protein [Candidatus Sumerlaeaceae bacterium]
MSPEHLVPVEFALQHDVGWGNSVFVQGDAAELGGGDVTRAVKLYYTAGAVWRARIGVPPSATLTYRYVNRADSAAAVAQATNGTPLTAYETTTTPAHPSYMPSATKSLVYLTAWAQPSLEVESSPGVFTSYSLTAIGPGRVAGERRWLASGFGVPGRAVRFRLTDGAGGYDYAPGGGLYETCLDRALLQDGNLFNYEPAPAVSPSRKETIANVVSPQGLASRTLRIYLPRGYDQHTTRSYPVLYMHDGQNIFGTTGSGFPPVRWNVDGTLDRLISMGLARETIVVGIDNTPNRLAEYTPPGAPLGGLPGGQGDKYLAYVRDTVKPLIDATYRTLPDAANTAVAGSSLGGLISTYMGLEAPSVFGKVAAFSPAYWANASVVARLTDTPVLPAWRHYFDSGNAGASDSSGSPDGYALTFDARDRLLRRGQILNRDVYHTVGYGQQHNESAWQARFPLCVRFLLPAEDEPSTVQVAPAASATDWMLH